MEERTDWEEGREDTGVRAVWLLRSTLELFCRVAYRAVLADRLRSDCDIPDVPDPLDRTPGDVVFFFEDDLVVPEGESLDDFVFVRVVVPLLLVPVDDFVLVLP